MKRIPRLFVIVSILIFAILPVVLASETDFDKLQEACQAEGKELRKLGVKEKYRFNAKDLQFYIIGALNHWRKTNLYPVMGDPQQTIFAFNNNWSFYGGRRIWPPKWGLDVQPSNIDRYIKGRKVLTKIFKKEPKELKIGNRNISSWETLTSINELELRLLSPSSGILIHTVTYDATKIQRELDQIKKEVEDLGKEVEKFTKNWAVVAKRANIRKGPGVKYKKIGQLKRFDEVEVIEEQEKWVKIRTSEIQEGWLFKKLAKPKIVIEEGYIELTDWKWKNTSLGISVEGVVQNLSKRTLSWVKINLILRDANGNFLGNAFNYTEPMTLSPEQTGSFSALATDAYNSTNSLSINYSFEFR